MFGKEISKEISETIDFRVAYACMYCENVVVLLLRALRLLACRMLNWIKQDFMRNLFDVRLIKGRENWGWKQHWFIANQRKTNSRPFSPNQSKLIQMSLFRGPFSNQSNVYQTLNQKHILTSTAPKRCFSLIFYSVIISININKINPNSNPDPLRQPMSPF